MDEPFAAVDAQTRLLLQEDLNLRPSGYETVTNTQLESSKIDPNRLYVIYTLIINSLFFGARSQ